MKHCFLIAADVGDADPDKVEMEMGAYLAALVVFLNHNADSCGSEQVDVAVRRITEGELQVLREIAAYQARSE